MMREDGDLNHCINPHHSTINDGDNGDNDDHDDDYHPQSSLPKAKRVRRKQTPRKQTPSHANPEPSPPSPPSPSSSSPSSTPSPTFPKIMLISLRAGGVGLNLTSANTVFMVDPWWNEAVENQAINRAFRIGQKRKVTVYRLVIQDSIEEKILKLQEKKEQLIQSTLDFQNSATIKLTVDEIAELLR